MFWSFLKSPDRKEYWPQWSKPRQLQFWWDSSQKVQMLSETYPVLGRSPAFPEGTCLVDDAPSLKHMENALHGDSWVLCEVKSQLHIKLPKEKYRRALLCWEWNPNHTETTGSYIRWSHQTSVYGVQLLSTYHVPDTFLGASPMLFTLSNKLQDSGYLHKWNWGPGWLKIVSRAIWLVGGSWDLNWLSYIQNLCT